MPLEAIACAFQPGRDAGILRSLTGLEKINGKPAAEFCKKVDGQQQRPSESRARGAAE